MEPVPYTERIVIAAPIERVYEHRLDFMNLTAVNPNVSDLKRTDEGDNPGPGATYSFGISIKDMGTMPSTLTVIDVSAPTRIVNDIDAGLLAHEIATLTETPDGTLIEIATNVMVPPETPEDGRKFIAESGSEQVRIELGNMKRLLEA